MLARKGFSVVEVLISFALFSLIAGSMTSAYVLFSQAYPNAGDRLRATFLAEEAIEVVKNISDQDFSNLVDGVYGITTSSNTWIFSGTNDSLGIYTRNIEISTVDSDTKKVVANVNWDDDKSVSLMTYFTNWRRVISSEKSWANATTSGFIDISGTQDGFKVQIKNNNAYVVRRDGNPRFISIDISDSYNPIIEDSLSLVPGSPLNIFINNNYAYISGRQNNNQIQVVDILSNSIVSTYALPANHQASGIYILGNVAYIASNQNPTLHALDISDPLNISSLGSITLAGSAREVVVAGNYAYVASTDNNQELQIIDVSNPVSLQLVASLNLAGNDDALTISLVNNLLFIGQGNNLRIVNVSNPLVPVLVSSLNLGGLINDIALNLANSNRYLFVATSNASAEFQIIDISDINSSVILTTIDAPGVLNGVAYDPVLDVAVAVGADNNQEVLIFSPQ